MTKLYILINILRNRISRRVQILNFSAYSQISALPLSSVLCPSSVLASKVFAASISRPDFSFLAALRSFLPGILASARVSEPPMIPADVFFPAIPPRTASSDKLPVVPSSCQHPRNSRYEGSFGI